VLTAGAVEAYAKASLFVSPLPGLPRLGTTWGALEYSVARELDDWETLGYLKYDSLREWARLALVIQENEPRFLRKAGFPEKYVGFLARFLELAENELKADAYGLSSSECRSESYHLTSIAETLEKLSNAAPAWRGNAGDLCDRLVDGARRFEERADELEEPEPEHEYEYAGSGERFDVDALFVDL
jgi:hypothetical protein